jgi:hypothetical protein
MQQQQLPPETQAIIDRLIPRPWSRPRQAAAAIGVGIIVVGMMYLWTAGWLTTNIEMTGAQFGGDGPVAIGAQLTNNGSRTIEILGAESPPGLSLVSLELVEGSLPAVSTPALLHPNGTATLLATYDVVDCAAIDTLDMAFTFDIRFADGVLQMKHSVDFPTEDFVFDDRVPGQVVSWPVAITQYVCQ